jgi:hypothetical protein
LDEPTIRKSTSRGESGGGPEAEFPTMKEGTETVVEDIFSALAIRTATERAFGVLDRMYSLAISLSVA